MSRQRMWRWGIVLGLGCAALPAQAQQRVAVSAAGDDVNVARTTFARPVTIHLQDVSLMQAMDLIAAQAGVRINYQFEVLEGVSQRVTLRANGLSLGGVMERVLAGTGLRAVSSLLDVVTIQEIARGETVQGTITGKVIHAKTKQPLAGVGIHVGGQNENATTDRDGTFRLVLPAGEHVIQVRGIGFVRQARRITVTAGETVNMEVSLEPSASVLDEVIVTGTVVATERKAIPNPITVITADDIERSGATKIEQLLRGSVPGVLALDQGTVVYSQTLGGMTQSQVYSRGSSSLDGAANPMKTFVDGVELTNPAYLGTIDPKSIERIEIITGPQAATIYGSGAMGGVMQIFTKKGSVAGTPDMTLALRYGTLESNVSNGYAPTHNHTLSMNGGSGPSLSYSSNLSYRYSGQWQPGLFDRSWGAQIGAQHVNGSLQVNASAALTGGRNGVTTTWGSGAGRGVLQRRLHETGEWDVTVSPAMRITPAYVSTSSALTLALNARYHLSRIWSHDFTVGRNQNRFDLVPQKPDFASPEDSLYLYRASRGERFSIGYNSVITPDPWRFFGTTITLGINGSVPKNEQYTGRAPKKTASSLTAPELTKSLDNDNWGAFTSWRIAFFEQLYFTIGLRAETSPAYGSDVKVNWTPNNGVTYILERGEWSFKFLASYGRSVRNPSPEMRLGRDGYTPCCSAFEPSSFWYPLPSPNLTPEYDAGPQGGVELYWGNKGSLTINHYRQKVTSLIQLENNVDSVEVRDVTHGYTFWFTQNQYRNVADIKKYGWEGTVSANIWMFHLRGTYSWADSRIQYALPDSYYLPGQQNLPHKFPTHTGSVTASYAWRGTDVTLTTNIMGRSVGNDGWHRLVYDYYQSRLKMYQDIGTQNVVQGTYFSWPVAGYAKSDLTASHTITSSVRATLNITNLGNSNGTDVTALIPALGRQISLGIAMRYVPIR